MVAFCSGLQAFGHYFSLRITVWKVSFLCALVLQAPHFHILSRPLLTNRHLPTRLRLKLFQSLIVSQIILRTWCLAYPNTQAAEASHRLYIRCLKKILRLPIEKWAQSNEQVFLEAQMLDVRARLAVDRLLYAQRVFRCRSFLSPKCDSFGREYSHWPMVSRTESRLAMDAGYWPHCFAGGLVSGSDWSHWRLADGGIPMEVQSQSSRTKASDARADNGRGGQPPSAGFRCFEAGRGYFQTWSFSHCARGLQSCVFLWG